jgi:arginase
LSILKVDFQFPIADLHEKLEIGNRKLKILASHDPNYCIVLQRRSQKDSGHRCAPSTWDSPAAASMGPSAVRVAGLGARLEALGHVVEDGGNVSVAIAEQKKEGHPHAKYLKEITATCVKHAELMIKTLESGKVPIVLGGDHSVAAGTVAGVAEFYRRQNQKIGLIWIDAHSDINTPESSPSGNVHGMPLAAIMGLGPPELANILNFSECGKLRFGGRPRYRCHEENIRKAGIEVFTMRDIDERGMRTVMEEALRMAGRGTAGITSH